MTERTPPAPPEPAERPANGAAEQTITCVRCGAQGVPLHRGCPMCEDCCDCRPLGT
ncbi:MAG: hypothetical protein JO036_02460 [Candidatus Eremiobacteraeota bacterium]|nr:hypothetical protein [Candidatus Eremiobacteraeota bacterium]